MLSPSLHNPGHSTPFHRGGASPSEPGYYNIPVVQAPVWSKEIPLYLFLGGLSGGTFLLSRMAARFGKDDDAALARHGSWLSLLALGPCPALLIADLGDPLRFHHMLRVFKPQSPMNLGTWTLSGFGGTALLNAGADWMGGRAARRVQVLTDVSGIPLAILLIGYTGVLLSGSVTPVWSRNPWLGPLFTAGGINSAAHLLSLAQTWFGLESKALPKIRKFSQASEAAVLTGYLVSVRPYLGALVSRKAVPFLLGAVAAGLGATALDARARGKGLRRSAALLGLIGGLCMRWAIFEAGLVSSRNARHAQRLQRGSGLH